MRLILCPGSSEDLELRLDPTWAGAFLLALVAHWAPGHLSSAGWQHAQNMECSGASVVFGSGYRTNATKSKPLWSIVEELK